MSYPRKLHILVIEDDPDAIEAYKTSFAILAKTYQFVVPIYARSFEEAKKHIESATIFHVVFLDLNLPLVTRQQPAEGFAPGEQLLEDLAKRDKYPIPAVIVLSGKLNLPHPLRAIQDRLAQDFWYGHLANKGTEQHHEIQVGLAKALEYVDVGIHIQDAEKEWFPTLSPREEDLLRRCVLSQPSNLGVDIRWWSAEPGPSISHPSTNRGPTKVLVGHFHMDDGMGSSIPTFFKFEPAGNGPSVCRDIGILAQKLAHIKVFHTAHSRQRSLIVTQSVTNRGEPISLTDYLHREPTEVNRHISNMLEQVVKQLSDLGGEIEDEVIIGSFLWEYLDRAAIDKAWKNCDTSQPDNDGCPNPLDTFDYLKTSQAKQWAHRRNCTHGDLNATNIAIDLTDLSNPQAYIFDAAGMKPDLDFRDLATLEVTTVLFNSIGVDRELVQSCRQFYASEFMPAIGNELSHADPFVQNVSNLIFAIRSRFVSREHQVVYALLVFDAALRQLSGLGLQPSPNKIRIPAHACYLAVWAAGWLRAVAPELFVQPAASPDATTSRESQSA